MKNIIVDIESYKKSDFVKKITIDKKMRLYDTFLKEKKDNQLPGVYIIKNSSNKFYIGESMNPLERLKEHKDVKFQKNSEAIVFQSSEFNKSVIYDIETKLINYFLADNPNSLLNNKLEQRDYDYFMKKDYKPVIKEIWLHLQENKWVSDALEALENKQIFKYSPYKALTNEQSNAIKKIEYLMKKNKEIKILLNGEAGTGKTILLIKLFVKYILCSEFKKIAFIIPNTELLKMVKELTKIFNNKKKEIFLGKPSELFKKNCKFNLILVDESHRLNGIKNYVMPNKVIHLKKGKFDNDIEMIKSFSKRVLFAYDKSQILRPGDMTHYQFKKSLKHVEKIVIKNQMRMIGAKFYFEWINNFLCGKLNKKTKDEKYDFKIFYSFADMYNAIQEKKEHEELVYLLSGYTRKKSKNKYDFDIENIKLNWNSKSKKLGKKPWIQTEKAKDLKEIGYYDYVQGVDMNYAGIIIGKDLTLNKEGKLDINTNYVVNKYDKPVFKNNNNFLNEIKEFILNRYKILLTRAIKGTYIYFEDEKLRKYFNCN